MSHKTFTMPIQLIKLIIQFSVNLLKMHFPTEGYRFGFDFDVELPTLPPKICRQTMCILG